MSTVKQGAGRPTRGYRLANGEKVPSVTSITSRFKDSGGLIHWAWQQGIDGINYRDSRDKAAEAGSICHGYIETFIHGAYVEAVGLGELYNQAWQGYEAFLDWANSVQLEVLETEVPLVSETYKFGGTFDALALVAGKPKLLDWKTSNAVYGEYVAQVAAYRQLNRERVSDSFENDNTITTRRPPNPDSALLLRIGKEHADFHLHSYPSSVLDLGWRYFLLAREMYELDKDLKKVAA